MPASKKKKGKTTKAKDVLPTPDVRSDAKKKATKKAVKKAAAKIEPLCISDLLALTQAYQMSILKCHDAVTQLAKIPFDDIDRWDDEEATLTATEVRSALRAVQSLQFAEQVWNHVFEHVGINRWDLRRSIDTWLKAKKS